MFKSSDLHIVFSEKWVRHQTCFYKTWWEFSLHSAVLVAKDINNASTTWHYVTLYEMTVNLMRCDICRELLWHQLSQTPTHDLCLGLKVHLGRHKQHANKCHIAMLLSKQYNKLNAHANHQLGSMSFVTDQDWSGQDCVQACLQGAYSLCWEVTFASREPRLKMDHEKWIHWFYFVGGVMMLDTHCV